MSDPHPEDFAINLHFEAMDRLKADLATLRATHERARGLLLDAMNLIYSPADARERWRDRVDDSNILCVTIALTPPPPPSQGAPEPKSLRELAAAMGHPYPEDATCDRCHGKGWLGADCPQCNGSGRDMFRKNEPQGAPLTQADLDAASAEAMRIRKLFGWDKLDAAPQGEGEATRVGKQCTRSQSMCDDDGRHQHDESTERWAPWDHGMGARCRFVFAPLTPSSKP